MDIPNFDELDGSLHTDLAEPEPLPDSSQPVLNPFESDPVPTEVVRVPELPSQLLLLFEEKYATNVGCMRLLSDFAQSKELFSIPLPTSADYLTDILFDDAGEPSDMVCVRTVISRTADPFHWEEAHPSREPTSELSVSPTQILPESVDSELAKFEVNFQVSDIRKAEEIMREDGPVPQEFKDRYLSAYTQSVLNIVRLPSYEDTKETGANRQFSHAIQDTLDVSNFSELLPNPAIVYPFELDTFQKRAVLRVEQGHNVFVAAHTSAGKTVVAEYAIALAKHHMSRVIYTSPIKALSNQKYRDFKELFGEVGIMTGDVVVDPESFCLVMTTEVLRSMLYRGSSKIKDLEWVILDEVHYINDEERGVVWEEVLIMLPPHVKLVMLSATVPNYLEFSDWVGRARNQQVYVQMTLHRPVPLLHQVFCNGQLWNLIEIDGTKQFAKYENVITQMQRETQKPEPKDRSQKFKNSQKTKGRKKGVTEDQRYKDLVRTLDQGNLLPCILFSFSRDKCDTRARKLGVLDMLTKPELSKVKIFISKAMKKLSISDQALPQVREIIKLLEHGVGIHHSGLLPILKEMVEILFAEGLVKVMVATETVAIGLNMPTKTVVFCEMRKFDGSDHRSLLPGEYTQMSGRAGRRGKDDCGHVIIFFKDPHSALTRGELETITVQKALDLTSKFRLGYNTIANVLMTEGLQLEDIAKKSFTQNDTINAAIANNAKLLKIKGQREALAAEIGLNDDPEILPAVQKLDLLKKLNEELAGMELKKCEAKTVLRVMNDACFNVLAVLTAYDKKLGKCEVQLIDFTAQLKLEKLLPNGASFMNRSIPLSSILTVHSPLPKSAAILKENDKPQNIKTLQDQIQIALKKQIASTTCFKPYTANSSVAGSLVQRDELISDIMQSPLFNHPNRHKIWSNFHQLRSLDLTISTLEQEQGRTDLAIGDQLQAKINVMKRFDLINGSQIVQVKGRAIAETNNPFNIIITELIFAGAFGIMETTDIPALCSLFVNDAKGELDEKVKEALPDTLKTALKMTEEIYGAFLDAERECQVEYEGVDLILRHSLVNPVYQWAKGVSFLDITKLTKIREGNIVRTILRIHEMMQRLKNVAVLMGNKALKNKLEESLALIARDIAFATSLYLTG